MIDRIVREIAFNINEILIRGMIQLYCFSILKISLDVNDFENLCLIARVAAQLAFLCVLLHFILLVDTLTRCCGINNFIVYNFEYIFLVQILLG
jgi:hypothetical protein